MQFLRLLKIDLFKLKQFTIIKRCFALTGSLQSRCMTFHIFEYITEKGKGKVHPCTGTEALYMP